MSLPLKLQIVKTLDASLFFPIGFRAIIEQTNVELENLTPYQRLTQCFMEKMVLFLHKLVLKNKKFKFKINNMKLF